MKLKKGGKPMACTKNLKIAKEGRKVVPSLKRTARKAVTATKKSYPY